MASPESTPTPITLTPALEVTKQDDQHRHRRRFIGPLPESVFLSSGNRRWDQKTRWKFWKKADTDSGEEDASLRSAIQQHALQFFLGHGGRKEDWGETAEHHVREEMLQKWTDSEWGRLRKERKEAKSAKRWVGNSFDVGVFLGVDILHQNQPSGTPMEERNEDAPAHQNLEPPPLSTLASETYVTAPSHFSPPGSALPASGTEPLSSRGKDGLPNSSSNGQYFPRVISVDSTTALLNPTGSISSGYGVGHHTDLLEVPPQPITMSDTDLRMSRGKSKMVHYSVGSSSERRHEIPAPPQEVLARSGSGVEDTSAGAAQQALLENQVSWEDTILRGLIFFILRP